VDSSVTECLGRMTEFHLIVPRIPAYREASVDGYFLLSYIIPSSKVLADFLRRDCPMEKEPRNEKTEDGLL